MSAVPLPIQSADQQRASLQQGRAFPIVIVGHVDHGKSTLVGRLLHDTDSLPTGKLEQLKAVSEKRGLEFEWSFLLDALQVERDQGITVDTTQIWFTTQQRRYVIIDAPGHKEFLKNMVTGAAQADAAILVVDAAQGLAEQTRRHAYLLHLLGIRQVAVAVNKIDLIGNDAARFRAVAESVRNYLVGIGIEPQAIVPLSAREGDNIASRSVNTSWYQGPTLIGALDAFTPRALPVEQPLRLPVQDLYRYGDKRIVVGRIESGRLKAGDRIRFAPLGREATVATLENWSGPDRPLPALTEARAGDSVAFTLDEDVFVERGALGSSPEHRPIDANRFTVRLFWLDKQPLRKGDRLTMKVGTAEREAQVESIVESLDVETLDAATAQQIERNGVARVVLRVRPPMAIDLYETLPRTGRGVLIRGPQIVAGLVIESAATRVSTDITAVDSSVTVQERIEMNGHRGGVIWMTGLSGAGKSTIAMATQRLLFSRGRHVAVLDGDNLRHGLNRDLGFTDTDRLENLRRLAEVAKLMAVNGSLVLVSAISPLQKYRDMAREIVGEDFREIYVSADIALCEARDPKGLYRKARTGEIKNFTGISAPYEAPQNADLVLDTAKPLEFAVTTLTEYIESIFGELPWHPDI
ncbi:adenylyl-sulfate kinase [Ferrovibrio terrae]|uniref:Adenylyl-sulfate kinase n=1 Tax=Ferrovibrio terrae TaxID=2594003 RepID=A0A516GYF0_9PROT|nr:adenylyl-sulfate kinase [Ferrovibrio terrae]QDO96522.1 adenylyl-sulfate kinase [Ferrovibrio terrae]